MLNFFLFYFLLITVFFESYKISLQNTNQNNYYFKFQKNNINFILLYYFILYIFILNYFFVFKDFNEFFLIFIFFIIFNIFFIKKINYKYISYFFIFSSITLISLSKQNLIIYILNAEFLSIFTFIVLFFNNNIKKIKQINVLYFLISNILATSFALLVVLIILNNIGSLNFSVFIMHNNYYNNYFINYLLFMYFLFKFGQGPAIIFKFKFYKNTNFFSIIFYLSVYLIFIWPSLSFLFYNIFFLINTQIKYVFILAITYFLLNSFLFFFNIFDFLVFSTWAFIWYQIFFII